MRHIASGRSQKGQGRRGGPSYHKRLGCHDSGKEETGTGFVPFRSAREIRALLSISYSLFEPFSQMRILIAGTY